MQRASPTHMNKTPFTHIIAIVTALGLINSVSAASGKMNPVRFDISVHNEQLPAFKQGARLVFAGDSITDMKRGRNESDRNHYLGHSFVFMLAGRLGLEIPEAQLDFYNRGISGNTVADLKARWQRDAIEIRPDVLTILVGTNDAGKGVNPAAFEADYRTILSASRLANPDLKIVLLDPFILKSGRLTNEELWNSRRATIDQFRLIVTTLANEYDAVHLKLQDIFDAAAEAVAPEHWLWDGVHPLPQGHELIARHWLKSVSARWPQDSLNP
jgi:lysophospholipase L1-like esterase